MCVCCACVLPLWSVMALDEGSHGTAERGREVRLWRSVALSCDQAPQAVSLYTQGEREGVLELLLQSSGQISDWHGPCSLRTAILDQLNVFLSWI